MLSSPPWQGTLTKPRSVWSSNSQPNRHYHTTRALLSLTFVANTLGFIIAALFVQGITDRLGRARTYALCQLVMAAGYVPMATAAPFPVFVLSFFLVGFGASFNLALGNVFCGSLQQGTSMLGVMHGAYGVGASVGPLLAGAVVRSGWGWSGYYLGLLGLAVFSAAFAAFAFRGSEEDVVAVGDGAEGKHDLQGMFTAVSTGVVLMGALFMCAYRGVEVSMSTSARSGSSGFVFWVGITVGRLLLWAPARKLDDRPLVYMAVFGAAAFEGLSWMAPFRISDTAALAVVGLLLGPVYPCATAVFMRSMGIHERVGGISVISAFGSSGGAAAPFTVGVLAELVGPAVLHPITIALCGVMMSCWYGLPKRPKRAE